MATITFTAKSTPECESFLKIKWKDEDYTSIDTFIANHPDVKENELDECMIDYRGEIKTHSQFTQEFVAFSERLEFVPPMPWMIIIKPEIRASLFYMNKAADCLSNARLFTMKSADILYSNRDLAWKQGYVPHFVFRGIYFGTASTWYSNAFDHLLQAVYWGYELFSSVCDRDGNMYDETWDAKKTMTFCTYEFVVGELKQRGLVDVRKLLTSCSGQIEEVRMWANYIKHKGGIDYKYLEPEDPFKIYVMPAGTTEGEMQMQDNRFAIENFKSPIQIDIDEKLPVMETVHKAIHSCIVDVISKIDYPKYRLQ